MTSPSIRLLVVDDSVYMQMAMRMIAETSPGIEIVGEASDGEQAVQMARSLMPDVITMDINMPGIDGLEATRRIMADCPAPIVMLSSLTEKGAAATFRALELGAVDYVSKSSSAIDVDLATIAEQVAAKIKFWGRHRKNASNEAARAAPPSLPALTDLLLIAAGAGGPGVVSQILRHAGPLPFPVLVAQDMPPSFTTPFIDFLVRTTGQTVHEGHHRRALERGSVTVLPGGRKGSVLRNESGALLLDLAPASGGPNMAADIIASAASAASSPLFVMLSGEARPLGGLSRALAGGKGALWVQTPEACVVEDLPRAALATHLESVTCNAGVLAEALRRGHVTVSATA